MSAVFRKAGRKRCGSITTSAKFKYANYFAVYPWMVDKNYEGLITRTLEWLGWHEVSKLRAQIQSRSFPRDFGQKSLSTGRYSMRTA